MKWEWLCRWTSVWVDRNNPVEARLVTRQIADSSRTRWPSWPHGVTLTMDMMTGLVGKQKSQHGQVDPWWPLAMNDWQATIVETTVPCSLHILHYVSSVKCKMNMEMYPLKIVPFCISCLGPFCSCVLMGYSLTWPRVVLASKYGLAERLFLPHRVMVN